MSEKPDALADVEMPFGEKRRCGGPGKSYDLPLSTMITITASFHPNNFDTEPPLALDLSLELLEKRTLKFLNTTTLQTRQVNMIPARPGFVIVLPSLQMHQVELIHQAVFL